ncbi:hypothetical protein [Gayadomonas joobiniege]|uniref:hypothetical protein n=1 Tax=Gayadomonas joobiniege TaxID=1234606 RepID=UPI0003676D78|nr:hypothetical protein [Gayadomonas joobiniege]
MKQQIFTSSLIAASVILAACSSDSDPAVEDKPLASKVAVHTVASDYISGQQTVLLDAQTYAQIESGLGLTVDDTDYSIRAHEDDLYLLGKYYIDTIAKFDTSSDTISTPLYTYSTQENGQEGSGNPYDLVVVSETKAYLIRYGVDNILIVNPSAATADDFITGSIDLSAYATASGDVNASDAHLVGDKLFVTMQRMNNWVAQTAYVAVFDTTTDTEVETNFSSDDAVKGIALQGTNPQSDSIVYFDDAVYVTTSGSWGETDFNNSVVEKIDLNDYSVEVALSSADVLGDVDRVLKEVIIVNDTLGYVLTDSTDWTTSALFTFNPSTGEFIAEVGQYGADAVGLSDIALDNQSRLWVSVYTDATPGLDVYSIDDNSLLENRIQFTLPPAHVEFLF